MTFTKPYPHPHGMPSFWRTSPGELDTFRSSENIPETTDIAIIGAGFSGGSLVTHLLSTEEGRGKSILVLEARELCSGATGRNGGHMKPDAYNMTSFLASKFNLAAAAEVAEFEVANAKAVETYIRDSKVECEYFTTRAVDVQLSESHNAALRAGCKSLQDQGVAVTQDVFYMDGADAEMISGIKGAKGAFSYTAGHVWPYKMIHHMFSQAVKSGINLQTNTPVISVSDTRDGQGYWEIRTERGNARAKQIIMATNAYTAALLPEYQDKIIPYRAICSRIVTPNPPPILPNTYTIRFNEWDFDYLIPRADGSIVVGGARRAYLQHLDDWYGNVDDSSLIKRAENYFDGYMQRHFRGWENSGAVTDQVWTGVMGYSSDRLPRIGAVPGRDGIFIMAGFTGHGMPQIFLAAKGISQMVMKGCPFSDSGIPAVFEETEARLSSKENFVIDLYNNLPPNPRI
ncbi:unnamed protein product [Clonostachys rosea f. rosea IK726]|uniref:FAD dependent oxidoreductase domain-containing protein n=2 Tax=Bionectria ochroleuca TaxID=29856 RepID=A0A0B7K2R6_BIOOC|nr:unnamed protein product [Clonostachys rosea f. rosea IK726]